MQVTDEQKLVIESSGNIKINAVAGSGKTTTLLEYAMSRPAKSKILYLCFNRSIKLEATEKFTKQGLNNIVVETGHSLAKRMLSAKGIKINLKKGGNYQTEELIELLDISGPDEETRFILANHILKFAAYYCSSSVEKVSSLNYRLVIEQSALETVNDFYNEIEKTLRFFLQKMDTNVIPMTHDFYLKKFQLSKPVLNYEYVLLDEGQDSSPAVLDIFMRQKGIKVIVGDVHQQIYSWRYAVNALEKVKFETIKLNRSFRFNEDIALLANKVLEWKNILGKPTKGEIIGAGQSDDLQTNATLARTNAGLLTAAIAWVKETKGEKRLYFEGNISSYTYAEAGTSLQDLLHFINKKKELIKDASIKNIGSIEKLKDYIKKTGDVQLKFLLEMALQYGNDLLKYLKQLKDCHVSDNDKLEADMFFSTVHRSKGMEYDIVYLADDFITEQKLIDSLDVGISQIEKNEEEINLLYVAVTRAKNKIYIYSSNTPKGITINDHIEVLGQLNEESTSKFKVNELLEKPEVRPINKDEESIHNITIIDSNNFLPSNKYYSAEANQQKKRVSFFKFQHVIGMATFAIVFSLIFFFIKFCINSIFEKKYVISQIDTIKPTQIKFNHKHKSK